MIVSFNVTFQLDFHDFKAMPESHLSLFMRSGAAAFLQDVFAAKLEGGNTNVDFDQLMPGVEADHLPEELPSLFEAGSWGTYREWLEDVGLDEEEIGALPVVINQFFELVMNVDREEGVCLVSIPMVVDNEEFV